MINNHDTGFRKEFQKILIIRDNIEKALNIKQARKSFKFFCDYVFGIKLGKIHVEWYNLSTKAMLERLPCVIFAPRGHGKCFLPDTLITLANGEVKKAKDCKIGDEVLALDTSTLQFVSSKIIDIIDNGIKDVYYIKLASGKEIIVTSNHPFLTPQGWKSIDTGLKENDKIAIPLYIPRLKTKKVFTDNQLKILGCLIGDGCVTKYKDYIYFTNSNESLVKELNQALQEEFNLHLEKFSSDKPYNYRIKGNEKKYCRKKFQEFLEKTGLAGKYSYKKEIPKELFYAPEEDIKLFLRYLWLCDGTIYKVKRKNEAIIEYSTTSKNLAFQIQTLLEYIGIPSNIYKQKTSHKDIYKVIIFGGKEFKLKFLKEILDKKTEDIQEFVENASSSTFAVIPRELVLNALDITPHYLRKYYNIRIDNKYDITYQKLKKLAELFPENEKLKILLNAQIRWDRIVKIKYKGKKHTIGLTIEKYHNHITNGIITHNTTVMSVLRPLFLLGHNPDLRIKIVSHSDKKASDILRQIKEAIENNEIYREVFPWVEPSDVWASNKILIKRNLWSKDVTIEALGILSGATGGRCLTEDTYVITRHGSKMIKDVDEFDLVLTKEKNFERVLAKVKRYYKGRVYYLKSKSFDGDKSEVIGLTPEHKVLIGYLSYDDKDYCTAGWFSIEEIYQFLNNLNKDCRVWLLFPKGDRRFYCIDIEDIEVSNYEGFVYDLTVENSHSFCSLWATLHNCDYIIFDDIVEFNNTIKHPALAKMVKEAFYNNWLNLLEANNFGWCLIGTVWTQMDLHWEMYQKPFKYKKIYSINLETLEPIWEEYWTKEKLLERYNSMPLRAFARAFANLPISREDAVFDKEKIEQCIVYSDPKVYLKKCDYVIMGVDLAISKKKGSANTAIFIMGVMKKKNDYKYVALHCEYGKWSSPETVNAIEKNYKDWKVDVIVVESNQYQEALIQWLEEFNKSLPVVSHYTTSMKHDPEIGLPSMAIEFQTQKWIIPMGKMPHSSDCVCGKCKWIEELTMYPFGETSDLVMASYFAREYWRKNKRIGEEVIVESW